MPASCTRTHGRREAVVQPHTQNAAAARRASNTADFRASRLRRLIALRRKAAAWGANEDEESISGFSGRWEALNNWFPAKVFVGDTYCYFAGMTFAVAAILGHNTKTVLLFFVPQLINFAYSFPQLLRVVPCPRHRMPGYLAATNQLTMSFADFDLAELPSLGRLVVRACRALRLAHVEELPGGRTRISNLTIINYALYKLGPMREDRLTAVLLAVQAACSAAALLVRYQLAGLLYDVVR